MNKSFFIIGFLIIIVGFFESYPAIEYARTIIPEHIYASGECDCTCIMESRPWYSTFNYWLWFCLLLVPILVFSVTPNDALKYKILRTVLAIVACYGGMIMAMQLMWDIRNGPFIVNNNYPDQLTWNLGCGNVADGASLVFTIFFGWIVAVVYTGLWMIIWHYYHKHVTKKINQDYKYDWFHKIVIWLSILLPILFGLWVFYSIVK